MEQNMATSLRQESLNTVKQQLQELGKRLSAKDITLDNTRDSLLTDFGKQTLIDRYLLEGETVQELFARVSCAYADNKDHAQRLYEYISKHWFMPSTPILSNGGTKRGLPISCFLNETEDSLNGIVSLWNENVWLASNGGGIGSYWGNLRGLGESVGKRGATCGIIPFIKVMDSQTLAISQGSLRRGSAAIYLPIYHPEIEEFIDIRRPTGGDTNRRSLNLHHGVCIDDTFMSAVMDNLDYVLLSPKDGSAIKSVNARNLWIKLLNTRLETGEPYIVFTDTVNKLRPDVYKELGLDVKMSNLCSEIVLTTGKDYFNKDRTAVCCLSSLNIDYYDEWKGNAQFYEDILRFLDNVLDSFIENAPEQMEKAVYAAIMERSIGLGVMGFHSYLQSKNIPFDCAVAKSINKHIFNKIEANCVSVNNKLALEKGSCPDARRKNISKRFTHVTAIAPTASISIIAGTTSPSIDPFTANIYTHKTLSGSFTVHNKHLKRLLESKGKDTKDVWSNIIRHEGSVQQLDFLTDDEKSVFKTALEINPYWIIEHAADRTPLIDQSQSVNLWLPANVSKKDLHNIHFQAWKRGLKSLYYLRSTTIQPAEKISQQIKYEDCIACQ
jgi:ribonucleoside-diphosphate reductase alpha chain